MLLTLSLDASQGGPPADRLSFLLHKHPDRCQSFTLPFGQTHIFYPECSPARATMQLLLDVDPIALSRRSHHGAPHRLWPHVNDRPYVCSSFMSVALNRVLRTAMAGRCKNYPELPLTPLAGLALTLHNLPVKTHPEERQEELLHRLFSPLGYTFEILSSRDESETLLDLAHPEWGHTSLLDLRLTHPGICLKDLLTHVYVLIPVLDDQKHYFIDHDEVVKLTRHGQEWLANHPEARWITARYLKRQRKLVRRALSMLDEYVHDEDELDLTDDATTQTSSETEQQEEDAPRKSLHTRRLEHVRALLLSLPEHDTVLDMGCGEGKMIGLLLEQEEVKHIIGVDVAPFVLERAHKRLAVANLPPRVRDRLTLEQGSLLYSSERLREAKVDVALLIEVIEHLEQEHLDVAMHTMLGHCQPRHLIITTPNVEYNALFETLPAGQMRHHDHRFEWDRDTFRSWAMTHAEAYGYTVRFEDVGDVHDTLGAQTQLAIFSHEATLPTTHHDEAC